MDTEFLDQLAKQLKNNKTPACRRAINRILGEVKERCDRGEYTSPTHAETAFRQSVDQEKACRK